MDPRTAHRAATIGGTATALYLDNYTIRRDVTYLVTNGIDPHEAVDRVMAHRRRGVVWGFFAAGAIPWSGICLGSSLIALTTGFVSFSPLHAIFGSVLGFVGLLLAYLVPMTFIWSWRAAAKGVEWEDTRNPLWPGFRKGTASDYNPLFTEEPGDGRRKGVAVAFLVYALLLWVGPVMIGLAGSAAVLFGGVF
jgi:hypothetical protein